MSGEPRTPAPPAPGAALALVALVSLVAVTPWPYGSVGSEALALVAVTALLVCACALARAAAAGGLALPALRVRPFAGFVLLALLQLLPLPQGAHRWLSPGSYAVWHPGEQAAARVLGDVARPLSLHPAVTLRGAALVAGLGLLALVAGPSLVSGRSARRAGAAVAIVGFVLAAYAIWARARFGSLLFGRLSVPTIAPFGPFVNKNHCAGWCAMAALVTAGLAAGLVASARRRGLDWTVGRRAVAVVAAAIASLAMALGVVASLSRGGAAGLAAGAAVLALLVRPLREPASRRRASWSFAVPALLAVALVAALAPPASRERLRSLAGAEFRLATWGDTLRLCARSPLVGYGLGAFHDAFAPAKRSNGTVRVEHAESEYLETLAETGAVGLGLALVSAVVLLRAGCSRRLDGTGGGVARGAAAALVAVAVHGAVDFELRVPANAALAALAAAAAASGAGVAPRPLSRRWTAALAVGCALLAGATLAAAPAAGPAGRDDVQEAREARLAGARALRLERADSALADALRRRPGDAEGWLLLAWVRAARGERGEAAALARHAAALDPSRAELVAAARRLASRAGDPP